MPKPTLPKTNHRLATVNAHDLKVNPVAQRDFRINHARDILAKWDINKFQRPHVNKRDSGELYIMEGQHGTWAYRQNYGDDEQAILPIQVELYEGLSETEEAEFFLSLNDKKAVDTYAKFKVGVTAGREEPATVDRIVRTNGCVVTNGTSVSGGIRAVSALLTIYRRHGADNLAHTIRTLRDSFGDGGYEHPNLLGVSAVLARYGLTSDELTPALLRIPRGSKGLAQSAALNREAFGITLPEATSAAIVASYNKGKRGRGKLAPWFDGLGAAA